MREIWAMKNLQFLTLSEVFPLLGISSEAFCRLGRDALVRLWDAFRRQKRG